MIVVSVIIAVILVLSVCFIAFLNTLGVPTFLGVLISVGIVALGLYLFNKWVDSGEPVEKRVESLLDRYDMRADDEHESRYEFLTFATDEYRERLRQKAFGWEL